MNDQNAVANALEMGPWDQGPQLGPILARALGPWPPVGAHLGPPLSDFVGNKQMWLHFLQIARCTPDRLRNLQSQDIFVRLNP